MNERSYGTTSLDVSSGERHEKPQPALKDVDSFDVDSQNRLLLNLKTAKKLKKLAQMFL